MKSFKNNNEFFLKSLHPDVSLHTENVNAFNIYSQDKFNSYLKKLGAEEIGVISEKENQIIANIKEEILKLKTTSKNVEKDRLEFDLAIIFHSNLKKLNWGRWLLDDYNMWRWFSLNNFLKEVVWRRSENKLKKGLVVEASKGTYDHLVGNGERLYDPSKKYELLSRLSDLSKESKSGGFGNLILNLIDTKLLSPNDHVAKVISEVLFVNGKLAEDKEVGRAFVRYNGFRRRLLNTASKEIFEKEICIG